MQKDKVHSLEGYYNKYPQVFPMYLANFLKPIGDKEKRIRQVEREEDIEEIEILKLSDVLEKKPNKPVK